MSDPQVVRAVLDPLDDLPVECDGFAQLATWHLRLAGVAHTVHAGRCYWGKRTIPAHVWLQAGAWVIDYRLRMWLGPDAPHGVFDAAAAGVTYQGQQIELHPTPEVIAILSIRWPVPSQDDDRWVTAGGHKPDSSPPDPLPPDPLPPDPLLEPT